MESNFIEVFNVLKSGFKNWDGLVYLVYYTAFCIGIFFVGDVLRLVFGDKVLSLRKRLRRVSVIGIILIVGSGVYFFYKTHERHERHKEIVSTNECKIVEGPVENFSPLPETANIESKGLESFTVQGIKFRYSDFRSTDAFNHSSTKGGPITPDSTVRICYDGRRHILKLEIKDFQGPIPDYKYSPYELSNWIKTLKIKELL